MVKTKPEILAPAGNPESFFAAIDAGADAVYLGLETFNARLRASNFNVKTLSNVIPYAHSKGRKVFVTLNTLVKQSEIEPLIHTLYQLEQIKPDGLIVADLGVVGIARKHFPRFALHASTQMVVHNRDGVFAAAALGFKRVVLARELTFDEIRAVAVDSPIELEVFIHGALCYSVSGLCLASSFLGGASGNRGRCTQVCRRRFSKGEKNGFYFSTRDLCALDYLARFREIGIASLKIEGRMKNAEYVRRVVAGYRRAMDCPEALSEIEKELHADMGREKCQFFLPGLDQKEVIQAGQFGGTGIFLGTVCSIADHNAVINTDQVVQVGDQLRIHPVSGYEGVSAKVVAVENSDLGKTITLSAITHVTVGAGVYLTATKNREAVRSHDTIAIDKVKTRSIHLKYPQITRVLTQWAAPPAKRESRPRKPRLLVSVDSLKWLPILQELPLDRVITRMSLDEARVLADDRRLLESWKETLVLQFPLFIPNADLPAWRKLVHRLERHGHQRWACSHWSQKRLCGPNDRVIADVAMPCHNRASQKVLHSQGFEEFCYSVEDDFPNIRAIASPHAIAYVFGRIPLFISRIRPDVESGGVVTDARHKKFIVYHRNGLFYLVSDEPMCLFHQRRRLDECGIRNYLIDFSFYTPEPTFARTVVDHFHSGKRMIPSTMFNFKTWLQ
jgi:U32 family peptidase